MRVVTAYVRTHRGAPVVRALHEAKIRGLSAYVVHGMSGETSTFLHGLHSFEPANLPEAVKIEVVCEDELVDVVVATIAQAAKTGYPGDGIISVQDVQRMERIRSIS